MAFVRRILHTPELYVSILLFAAAVACCVSGVGIKDAKLQVGNQPAEKTTLPVAQKFEEPFNVSFKVSNLLEKEFDLRIIPDDCATALRVNGEEVSLAGRTGLCDYGHGFILNHEELAGLNVKDGAEVEVAVTNKGGNGGVDVLIEQASDPMASCLRIFAMILLAILSLLFARRMNVGVLVAVMIALGVALRFGFYLDLPKYDKFGHDVDGHVAYVKYIAENHAIPADNECWTCYHPPVYFVASVPAWEMGRISGPLALEGLQVESLLFSILFLFVACGFFKEFLTGAPFKIATALMAFWPVLILVSPRIGNDQLFYLLHAVCVLCGYKYLKSGVGKYLVIAAVATALAIWTKSTGMVTLGTLALFAVGGYVTNFRSLIPSKTEVAGWLIFVLTIAGVAVDRLLGDSDLVGNSQSLHSGLKIGNAIGNFVYFDLKSFLTEPYTSPWTDGLGREYFLNYMFKTSLFGEFKLLETAMGKILATVISMSFLGMVVVAARGFWSTKLRGVHWILLLQAVAFVAALAFLRNKIPFSCSNDFRYIVPVLLSFVPFVSMGLHVDGSSTKWKVFGYAQVIIFVVASALLMINVV